MFPSTTVNASGQTERERKTQLTPWSTDLPEKLVKKFPAFYKILRFIILSQIDPAHVPIPLHKDTF